MHYFFRFWASTRMPERFEGSPSSFSPSVFDKAMTVAKLKGA
jgi:hypothetical protein